ncbi:MAG: energy transducer TonB [Gemmatimonadetes bacterium]|nr:energy transducer TonB [Gemmatimonadota bacterium]
MSLRTVPLVIFAGLVACAKPKAPDASPTAAPISQIALFYSPEGAQPAQPLRFNGSPRYPDALRRARVEGAVVAHYIIDTTGTVLPGSLKIVKTSDTLFANAVRDAVDGFRFAPATLNGRKIRQLVEHPVYFDMVDGAAKQARPPQPRAVATTDPTVRAPMLLGAMVVTAVPSR